MLAWNDEQEGEPLCLLCWKRTAEEQALLYARKASSVRYSKHQDGLAMDFCFLNDLLDDGRINWDIERYRKIGEYWEFLGGRWGGRFGDNPATYKIEGWDAGHFEYIEIK